VPRTLLQSGLEERQPKAEAVNTALMALTQYFPQSHLQVVEALVAQVPRSVAVLAAQVVAVVVITPVEVPVERVMLAVSVLLRAMQAVLERVEQQRLEAAVAVRLALAQLAAVQQVLAALEHQIP